MREEVTTPQVETFDEAVERLLRARLEQGLPERTSDPSQLAVIARVLQAQAAEPARRSGAA